MIPKMNAYGANYAAMNTARMSGANDTQQWAEQARESKFQADLAHVQAHENAHYTAAGEFAAGGPVINADYANKVVYGGHVPIKMSFGKTADDALNNARKIAAAALSPGDPSGQDSSVAASAMSKGSQIAAQRRKQEEAQVDKGFSSPFQKTNPVSVAPAQNPFAKPNSMAKSF